MLPARQQAPNGSGLAAKQQAPNASAELVHVVRPPYEIVCVRGVVNGRRCARDAKDGNSKRLLYARGIGAVGYCAAFDDVEPAGAVLTHECSELGVPISYERWKVIDGVADDRENERFMVYGEFR